MTKEISYNGSLLDGRRKLTEEQKEEIRNLYEAGEHSWQSLAHVYKVAKRTIGLTVSEEYAQKLKDYNSGKWRDRYDKNKHRKAIKKYRDKKRRLGYINSGGAEKKSKESQIENLTQ